MLAYRHEFHAGNHADVLKHVVLVALLRHLTLKPTGLRAVDTHAGAGLYALGERGDGRRPEHLDGIARLFGRADLPPIVADYVGLVGGFNRGGTLRRYPGSPLVAARLLRPQDQLRLYERHPRDLRILARTMRATPNVEIHAADGFTAVAAQWPPPTRRGLLAIDPSYELKSDYARVPAALREALARSAESTVMIWLPQLQLLEAARLPDRLKAIADPLARKGWLHARLTVAHADPRGFGLLGSSVFVVNPPHTLRPALAEALPWLAEVLQQGARAHALERSASA